MNRIGRSTTLLGALLLAVGCSSGESQAGTTDLSRSLLSQTRPDQVSTPVEGQLPADSTQTLDVSQIGVDVGSEEAPIKVIEFVDFGCGFCRQFHMETFSQVRHKYIDGNIIQWKFVPFISGNFPNSPVMTEAAECAVEQGGSVFGSLSDLIWEHQGEWKPAREAAPMARAWAQESGADMDRFDSCLSEDRRTERMKEANELAGELGIRATPTFWILGFGPVQGALPWDVFDQIFEEIHTAVTAAQANGDSVAPEAN